MTIDHKMENLRRLPSLADAPATQTLPDVSKNIELEMLGQIPVGEV